MILLVPAFLDWFFSRCAVTPYKKIDIVELYPSGTLDKDNFPFSRVSGWIKLPTYHLGPMKEKYIPSIVSDYLFCRYQIPGVYISFGVPAHRNFLLKFYYRERYKAKNKICNSPTIASQAGKFRFYDVGEEIPREADIVAIVWREYTDDELTTLKEIFDYKIKF